MYEHDLFESNHRISCSTLQSCTLKANKILKECSLQCVADKSPNTVPLVALSFKHPYILSY